MADNNIYGATSTPEAIRAQTAALGAFQEALLPMYQELKKAEKDNNMSEVTRLRGELKAMQAEHGIDDSSYNSVIGDIENFIGNETFSDKKLGELKTNMAKNVADMGLQALKTGTSLQQISRAKKAMKDLKKPTPPQATTIDDINTRIQDLQMGAAGYFPEREANRQRDYAEAVSGAKRGAEKYGLSGAALQQVGMIQAGKNRAQDRLGDADIALKQQGMLDNMIGLKTQEQARLDAAKAREFYGYDVPQYQRAGEAAAGLMGAGYQNLYGTLEGMPGRIPGVAQSYSDLKGYLDYQDQIGASAPQNPLYQPPMDFRAPGMGVPYQEAPPVYRDPMNQDIYTG